MRISRVAVACLLAFAAGATSCVSAAFAAPEVKVVATGLNSPKHLLYTSRGLYVVESGTGGPEGPGCVTAPSTVGAGTTKYCAGLTASVALIHGGHTTIAAASLPSVIEGKEGTAAGPSAVTVSGSGRLSILYQDTLVNPNGSNSLPAPASSVAGTFQISPGVSANIAAFDAQHPQTAATLGGTPGETTNDSDPYDVIPYRGGYVVADAAANSLLRVSKKGKISMLAHFPTQPEMVPAGVFGPTALTIDAQAVPTAVAIGRDGALYVGLLRGVPSEPGSAEIYRVVPGHAPKVWAKGLTAVTAIAFDRKGRLLATELSTGGLLAAPKVPGALVRVSANGKKVTVLAVSGLTEPTGVAVARSGAVYVANHGTSAGSATPSGEVLEISGLG
jgi:hypothetical protein